MQTRSQKRLFLSICLVVLAAAASDLPAQNSCTIEQLTRTGVNSPLFHADSEVNRLVILSPADLAGNNSDGSHELFVLDLANRTVEQITDFPFEPLSVDFAQLDQLSLRGIISDDLNRYVFHSQHDLTGNNPDLERELFLLDRAAGELTQLTQIEHQCRNQPPPCLIEEVISVGRFSLSGDGRLAAYKLLRNGVMEFPQGTTNFIVGDVALHNLDNGSVILITDAQPDFSEPFAPNDDFSPVAFSPDGSLLAYENILLGSGSSVRQNFIYNVGTGASERFLPGDPTASAPRFSPDGSILMFTSELDYTGDNPQGLRQLFLMDAATREIRQIGRLKQDLLFLQRHRAASLSGDSTKLVRIVQEERFREENPLEVNSVGERLLLYDLQTGAVNQIGYTERTIRRDGNGNVEIVGESRVGFDPHLNHDGSRLAFSSRVDFTGDNPTGSVENYLSSCAPSKERFVAQVGDGVNGDLRFETSFLFTNVGNAATIEIDFFASDGTPLELELADLGRASQFRVPIRSGESLTLETTGEDAPVAVGYARITAPDSVGGTAVFTRSDARQEVVLYEAGVPIGVPLGEFTIPVDDAGDRQTGIALAAPPVLGSAEPTAAEENPTQVTLKLYDRRFELLGERVVELLPGEHAARFVRELFPQALDENGELHGILSASGSRSVAVAALRQAEGSGRQFPQAVPTLTTFPVVPGTPAKTPVMFVSQ